MTAELTETSRPPHLDESALRDVGRSLHRPECVLCTSDGAIYVSDWRGGVTRIAADGRQDSLLAANPPVEIRPNGIALQADGTFLLANLGDAGGVWRLEPDGRVERFVTEVAGSTLPPCNFVLPDRKGRVWVTVSTRYRPRDRAYRRDVANGFVVSIVDGKARIAADGLGYTNEVQVHPDGDHLYVNETFARRLSRFRIHADGTLGVRETVARFGAYMYPDGLCFDETGAIWIVSIVSNRVVRLANDGQELVIADADGAHLAEVEQAYLDGVMGRPHLDHVVSKRLRNISSIAFGGAERRICYLGCLLGDRLHSFEAPATGIEPVHWNWRGM